MDKIQNYKNLVSASFRAAAEYEARGFILLARHHRIKASKWQEVVDHFLSERSAATPRSG